MGNLVNFIRHWSNCFCMYCLIYISMIMMQVLLLMFHLIDEELEPQQLKATILVTNCTRIWTLDHRNSRNPHTPISFSYTNQDKIFNIIQSSSTWEMLTIFSDFKGNTVWNLISAQLGQEPNSSEVTLSDFWWLGSRLFLWLVLFPYMHNSSLKHHRHAAAHTSSLPLFIFHLHILHLACETIRRCKTIIGMSRARRKTLDKNWNCAKVLLLTLYPSLLQTQRWLCLMTSFPLGTQEKHLLYQRKVRV